VDDADGSSWIEETAGVGRSLAGAAPAGDAGDAWWLAADDGLLRAGAGPEREVDVAPCVRRAGRARRAAVEAGAGDLGGALLPRLGVASAGMARRARGRVARLAAGDAAARPFAPMGG
jgi:hypothetical protein